MEEYVRELDLALERPLCWHLCRRVAESEGLTVKFVPFEGEPTLVALDVPEDPFGWRQPIVILFNCEAHYFEGKPFEFSTTVRVRSAFEWGVAPTSDEYTKSMINTLAKRMQLWTDLLEKEDLKNRRTAADRHEADTAPGTILKGAAGAAAKAVAGGVFKKAKEAVNKKRFEVGPNETVLLQMPAGRLRRNGLKDRMNKYARENLTTPLVIGTGAAATLLGNRYQVDGRMTVTDRRLLFEPAVWMVGEPPVEVFLDDIAEVVDDRTYTWWNRQIGIVTTRGKEYLFVVVNKYEVMDLLNERVREVREAPGSLGEEPPPVNADFKEGKKGVGELFDLGTGSTAGMGEKLKGLAWNRMRKRKAEPSGDLSSELKRLADLRDGGVLTEEEFRRAKGRLIDG